MWILKSFRKCIIFVIFFSIQANLIDSQKFLSNGESSAIRQNLNKKHESPLRLPSTTYPLKYHLHITTWIHQEIRNFTGHVSIELQVKESTSELVLHAKRLKIRKFSVQDLTAKQEIKNLKLRTIDDLLIIGQNNGPEAAASFFGTEIFVENHRLRLEIDYSGIINPPEIIGGFSVMTYNDERNKTIYGAYTFMPSYKARTVLPCYDEPGLKANFTVRITHGSNYTAILNMPAISSVENGKNEMTTTSFMETPPMSTYLLAFAISNFKCVAQESNGILQRVFLPPSSKLRGDLILKNTIEVTQVFAQYMDVPYSLPKLDHIHINEFGAGGMENWGLITYGNPPFLETSQYLTQNHEIVHQWFGDLVSPAWWDSTWLSEGFAEYYGNVLRKMTSSNSEYKSFERAYENCTGDDLYNRLLAIVGSIEMQDSSLHLYVKAPCVIQMFQHAFGEPIFRKGLSNYLKSRAFSSANETHLYDNLQGALLESTQGTWNYSVHEIMSTWIHAKTVPIVTITRDYTNSNIIHIRQRASRDDIKEFWWIPFNFATTSQQNLDNTKAVYYMPPIPAVTLNLAELNITLNSDDWLVANIRCTAFYRIEYDEKNMRRLGELLQKNHSVCCDANCKLPSRSSAKAAEIVNQH